MDLVEDAEAAELSAQEKLIVEASSARTVVGDPAQAADQLRSLATEFDVDEVMINPVASTFRGTALAASPARERTVELLAKELL